MHVFRLIAHLLGNDIAQYRPRRSGPKRTHRQAFFFGGRDKIIKGFVGTLSRNKHEQRHRSHLDNGLKAIKVIEYLTKDGEYLNITKHSIHQEVAIFFDILYKTGT